MKAIIFIILISQLLSCAKKPATVITDGNLSITFLGVSNFGKVILGQSRTTVLRITNNSKDSKNIPSLSPQCSQSQCPFTLTVNNCPTVLLPGSSCTASIKFEPTSLGTFNQTIDPSGFNKTISGQGVVNGYLEITNGVVWNIGTIVAGNSTSREFVFRNPGESRVPSPTIANVSNFINFSSNCEENVLPGDSCNMLVVFNRTSAISVTENLQFFSTTDNILSVEVTSNVIPSYPDGKMEFSYLSDKILSDGSEIKNISIIKIPDIYGNKVTGISQVRLTSTYSEFVDLSGNSLGSIITRDTDTSGNLDFRIRALPQSGVRNNINISSISGNSNGLSIIKPLSGKPYSISIMPFLNSIKANGLSSVNIQTEPILDSNGGFVDDGTKIYFNKVGGGTLSTTMSLTYRGIAYVKLTSPTSVGSAIITAISEDGLVLSENKTVNYIPGSPAGNFNVIPDNKVIYFKSDISGEKIDSTLVRVGPIKDAFNQNVGSGYLAQVSITNGYQEGSSSIAPFNIFTDQNSMAYFNIEAGGNIGIISLEVNIQGIGAVSNTVYSSTDRQIRFKSLANDAILYKTYGPILFNNFSPDTRMLPNETSLINNNSLAGFGWDRLYRSEDLFDLDDVIIGQTTYTSDSAQIVSGVFPLLQGFNCIQNVGQYSALFPCFYNKELSSVLAPPNGASLWGNSGMYILGKDGTDSIFQSANINYEEQMGNPSNHGSYATAFPLQGYLKDTNEFFTYGGLQFLLSDFVKSLKYNSTSSFYSNSEKVSSGFDRINYSRQSVISHEGIFLASNAESEYNGTFIYGGFKRPTEANGYVIDNTISRITSNEDGEVLFEKIVILPDFNGFIPNQKLVPGFFYDNSTNDVYLIGGFRKSGLTYSFDDTIWKFNFKDQTKRWLKVCDQCGLPVMDSNPDVLLNFPTWPADYVVGNFTALLSSIRNTYVFKSNDGNIYLNYEGSINGESWILNLKRSSNLDPMVFEASTGLKSFSSNSMLKYNNYSGRLYGFKKGVNYLDDSTINFYESEESTKPYYMSVFNLGAGSLNTVLSLKFKISAYGKSATNTQNIVSFYVYNFINNTYEVVGQSVKNNDTETKTNASIINVNPQDNPSKYLSPTGKIYLIVMPGSSSDLPSNSNNDLTTIRINSISLEGVW